MSGVLRIAACLVLAAAREPGVCAVFAEFSDGRRGSRWDFGDDVHVRVPATSVIVWGAYACFVPAAVVVLLGVSKARN